MKLVVPAQRAAAVQRVFEERLRPYLDSLPDGAKTSLEAFLRHLVASNESLDDLTRWRGSVRAEGLRRHEAEGGWYEDCEW